MVEMDPLSNREPLDVLAEDFCRRHRRGESPQIAEYVAKYPELADEIRQLLPTLRWMEDLKTTFDEGSQSSTQATAPRQPSWIGEYRVIREIGRGGMGIVYEAQQPSLDRRVAVKVLPHGLFSDDRQRKRFEHEARAAARLHHTNIVPIFGVGEHDGVPFYSMQYIPGQSLDRIIAAVRTASSGKHEPDETQPEELDSTAKDP